jgi:hypothetical protein
VLGFNLENSTLVMEKASALHSEGNLAGAINIIELAIE